LVTVKKIRNIKCTKRGGKAERTLSRKPLAIKKKRTEEKESTTGKQRYPSGGGEVGRATGVQGSALN